MQSSEAVQIDLGKAQVVDRAPKVIKEIKFGVLYVLGLYFSADSVLSCCGFFLLSNDCRRSNQDMVSQSVVEVSDRKLFDLDHDRTVARHGPLDGRMGISSKSGTCETCGGSLQACNGHFGHVRLVLPAFHVGYFKRVISILQEICKVRRIHG